MKASKDSPIIYLYFFSIILLMLSSMKVCWLWSIPGRLLLFFAFFTTGITITAKIFRNQDKNPIIVFAYVLIVLTGVIWGIPSSTIGGYISNIFIRPFVIMGVLFLKDEYKHKLFEWFVAILSIILLISIPAWLLYLTGFPFSHDPVYDVGDGYHFMFNYNFFVISYNSIGVITPRFASIFLEPGWIGTICCFVLFGLKFNFKRLATYLCTIGILLSLSLSAVINLVVCGLLWSVLTIRHNSHKLKYFIGTIIIFGSIGLFAVFYNNGDNALNERIMERLAFDEDIGIVGNNRSNETLDNYLEKTLKSSDRWFGIAQQMNSGFAKSKDWYNRSSGIKKQLLTYGIIGVSLLLLFFTLILRKYKCKQSFVFYICFLMASFVRDLWQTDCYMILYIIILSELYSYRKGKSKNIAYYARLPKK